RLVDVGEAEGGRPHVDAAAAGAEVERHADEGDLARGHEALATLARPRERGQRRAPFDCPAPPSDNRPAGRSRPRRWRPGVLDMSSPPSRKTGPVAPEIGRASCRERGWVSGRAGGAG